tara:strand:- start:445 stop:885 length:441 start_codon:yes stop_codon:yes gene_type:complete
MTSKGIEFFVAGKPETQSGMKTVVTGGGKFRMISSGSKGLPFWRQRIATEAQAAMDGAPLFGGPLAVAAHFMVPRPKSRPKKYQHADKQPDIDKLLRALLDALTGTIYEDDRQIVQVNVRKAYAGSAFGCSEVPGVKVFVDTIGGS